MCVCVRERLGRLQECSISGVNYQGVLAVIGIIAHQVNIGKMTASPPPKPNLVTICGGSYAAWKI